MQARGRKGKFIFRKRMVLVLGAGARGLCKLMVQENAADSRYVRQHAVEHFALRFILIETQPDKITQISPALRTAKGKSGFYLRAGGIRAARIGVFFVAQRGNKITRCREADAMHLGIFRGIVKFVNRSAFGRRIAGQQMDFAVIGEGPAAGGNCLARAVLAPSDSEFRQ